MDAEQLDKLFETYIQNETERGSGGVLHVKESTIAYKFPNEFGRKDFASKLQETLDDGKENIYIVYEKNSQYHLFAYPKNQVFSSEVTSSNQINESGNNT